MATPTKADLHYHLGDDSKNCGLCQNWELLDERCSVLKAATARTGVCDSFIPLETDTGAPADLGPMSETTHSL